MRKADQGRLQGQPVIFGRPNSRQRSVSAEQRLSSPSAPGRDITSLFRFPIIRSTHLSLLHALPVEIFILSRFALADSTRRRSLPLDKQLLPFIQCPLGGRSGAIVTASFLQLEDL